MTRIPGPAGPLESRYDAAPRPAGKQAVLCHPHPQYGGSLHDGVLDVVARVLLEAGIGVLRFNFRGVGASAGRYDGGRGERSDLQAAAAWLQAEFPSDALWAGGYSFGAWVTWQALGADLQPARVLLVAPPIGTMAFAAHTLSMPVDAVAGSADAFIDQTALQALPGVRCHLIDGADHFFSGHDRELAEVVRRVAGTGVNR
jgi:uncharacterized protein